MKFYPNIAFALGGLAGNNAHGAGFLQAALDQGVKPAMISCTSEQIFWVSKFLEHMNQPECLEMDFDEKLAELKPRRLWCDKVAETLGDGPWIDSANQPWPFAQIMDNLPWRDIAFQSIFWQGKSGVFKSDWAASISKWVCNWQSIWLSLGSKLIQNKLADLFFLKEFVNTIPGAWLKPDFPEKFFKDVSDRFNDGEHGIGIVFNSYDPVEGLERIHFNKKAGELLGRKYSPPGVTRGSYRHRLRYDPITPVYIKEALWFYLYGFDHGSRFLDGAYYREVILSEVCGKEIDSIYVARPIRQQWQGPLPTSFIESKDLETEVSFNGSYRGERDKIDLINKIARKVAEVKRNLGKLDPEMEVHLHELFKYQHIHLVEIEIDRQRGFYGYVFEDKQTFDKARAEAKKRLPPTLPAKYCAECNYSESSDERIPSA